MKKNWKRKILTVFTSLFVLLSATTVMAAESSSGPMPDLSGTAGTLKIVYQCSDEASVTNIDGATVEVTKVADVTVENGIVSYNLLSAYQPSGVSFDGMTTEQSIQAASSLNSIKNESGETGMTAVTDSNGTASFSDLSEGMYLVTQTGSSGTAQKYESFAPFLVKVPQNDPQSQTWIYDVTASPKTGTVKIETPPEKPSNPPEKSTPPVKSQTPEPSVSGKPITGDIVHAALWIGIILVSAAGILLLVLARKKQTDSDKI